MRLFFFFSPFYNVKIFLSFFLLSSSVAQTYFYLYLLFICHLSFALFLFYCLISYRKYTLWRKWSQTKVSFISLPLLLLSSSSSSPPSMKLEKADTCSRINWNANSFLVNYIRWLKLQVVVVWRTNLNTQKNIHAHRHIVLLFSFFFLTKWMQQIFYCLSSTFFL